MNNSKIEEYKVIEVKPGVYLRSSITNGSGLTEDITTAKRFAMDDFQGSSNAARKWFGEVKTMRVVTEVK